MWVMVPVDETELPAITAKVAELQGRMMPARPRRILEIMFSLIRRHKQDQKGRTDSDWEEVAHEYVADLGQVSEAHLLEAIIEYRRSNRWMPHQSELIEICQRLALVDKELLRRGQVLLGQRAPHNWEGRLLAPPHDDTQTKVVDLKPILDNLARGFSAYRAAPPPPREPRASAADMLASRDPDAVERLRAARAKENQSG